jgi:hypothetical protein
LAYAVPYPIVPHIHGFGSALFDTVIGNAGGSASIAGDHGGRRLGAAELFQGNALGTASLPLLNSPADSASVALETTSRRILAGMLMGPLSLGWGASGAGFLLGFTGWELR